MHRQPSHCHWWAIKSLSFSLLSPPYGIACQVPPDLVWKINHVGLFMLTSIPFEICHDCGYNLYHPLLFLFVLSIFPVTLLLLHCTQNFISDTLHVKIVFQSISILDVGQKDLFKVLIVYQFEGSSLTWRICEKVCLDWNFSRVFEKKSF